MIPTLEGERGGSGSQSDSSELQVTAASDDASAVSSSGPSVAVSFSDGSTVELDAEDLKLYLLAIQTFLLVYVAFKEVSA